MKTRNIATPGYTKRPLAGRAAFIHRLHRRNVPKAQALAKTQAKFNASKKAFEQIWSVQA